MKTTTFSIVLLVTAALILGAALPAMSINVNPTKLNEREIITGDPTGLDPKWANNPVSVTDMSRGPSPASPLAEEMYGFICYGAGSGYPNGPCWWPLDDPGALESINSYTGNWMAGATWTCDEKWLACQYGTGVLFEIDPEDGEVTAIGGGGTGCHGLAWDPVYNRLYGTDGSNLIEYDPDTGEQEVIGSHGVSQTIIAIAINLEGICHGYDVKFGGNAILYTIDLETGESIEEVDMGQNLVYAQDGAYDWETGILWLAAYSSTGFLAYWDADAEELVTIDNFYGGAEIAGAMIQAPCIPPEHDVSVKKILSPVTGPADDNMPITVLVKNTGNNTETFNCQFEIIKCEAGDFISEEYFDGGTFPPEGWETDYWSLSYTNNAGGESPEARVYKYDYGGQTYDNYLCTNQIDCTGLEKVNLRFMWASDLYYPQYCSAFVKFQRNSTSSWKDVTPWDNPIGSNQDPELYEIGCYGFGEPMGDEFRMNFTYQGYYYYFNYFWLDEVTLEACGGCAEYAELVEYITLDAGEEMEVEFPVWTPSEWHNESSENTWEEYPLHAWVQLEGDQNPRNDEKWLLIDLWYPWMHDIALQTIDSPKEEEERIMPAQTFPVVASMKNAGQYPECCIPIEIMIGQPVILDTLFEEYDWPYTGWPYYYIYGPGYGSGWTDEHKNLAYYYGWRYYTGSQTEGDPPEAYAYYYYMRADYVFYTTAIDASEYTGLKLEFESYINHYSGSGLYTLEAGYSLDGEEWYAAWSEEPSSSQSYTVSVPIEGGHEQLYIGFWVKGNPYYFNYWYVDNVRLIATGLIEEFTDNACQGPDIEPGDTVTFEFDDWTPEFLAEETSHPGIEYIAQAFITMEGDKNPGNDLLQQGFELKYWHDVGIDAVTAPTISNKGDILYDNGLPDGRNGCFYGWYAGYETIMIDDFENEQEWTVDSGTFNIAWNSAAGEGNFGDVEVVFYEETDDCDPSTTEYYRTTALTVSDYATGDYYFSRPEIVCEVTFDPVVLQPGKWWVGFIPESTSGYDFCAWLTTEVKGNCMAHVYSNYFGWSKWTSSQSAYGDDYDGCWTLQGFSKGPPGINVYIQPGSEAIGALAKNYGTFKHLDLTCFAEVWEYITDPLNGTQIYTDQVDDIDLDVPLGGTEQLSFSSCTFATEGRYGLYLDMPPTTAPDDEDKNNKARWGVAVDDSPPTITKHVLTPSAPNGLEGWYVSDLEIYVEGTDPLVADVASGVAEIHYTINGGAEEVVAGDSATIVVTNDGENIDIKYWAVDNVGNAGPKNTTTIDMDQTAPSITLSYEQVGGAPGIGADILCTMNATDAMSKMDRVEFYLNDVLQATVPGSGPVYQWDFKYHGVLNIYVTATAYDIAGNHDSLIIDEFEIENMPRNAPHQHSSNNTPRGRPLPR